MLAAAPLLALVSLTSAAVIERQADAGIKTLLVFGDSYSDECNAWRIQQTPEVQAQYPFPQCPPAPEGRASGGYQWPEYVRNNTGMNVFNYASSGATCNNTLFPRGLEASDGQTVWNPDVGMQIDQMVLGHRQGEAFDFDVSTAVAAIFIGTNDLTFFVGKFQDSRSNDTRPIPGTTVVDHTGCILNKVNILYRLGVRHFLVFNKIPLHYTQLFSWDDVQGYGYRIQQNGALIANFIEELVISSNALQALQLPALQASLPDSSIETFDTFNFYWDLITNPQRSFGPDANVHDFCNVCPGPEGSDGNCTRCENPQDYLLFDQLHPSERSGQLLAEAVVQKLQSRA